MLAVVSTLMIVVGVGFLMHGRTLPTWKEEEEKGRDDSFFYEFLYGPPGSSRSKSIGGGIGLIGGGLLMLTVALIQQFR